MVNPYRIVSHVLVGSGVLVFACGPELRESLGRDPTSYLIASLSLGGVAMNLYANLIDRTDKVLEKIGDLERAISSRKFPD